MQKYINILTLVNINMEYICILPQICQQINILILQFEMISNNFSNQVLPQFSETELLKKQNSVLLSKIAAYQHEKLISQKKTQALDGEINRLIKENHRLILQIDHEKTQKLKIIENAQNIKNELSFESAEIQKYETQNKRLTQQNQNIKSELQTAKLQKLNLLKQKQNACNKLIVSEAKLQALTMQQAFINASLAQNVSENLRLKEEVETLNKRLSQNSGAYVKTVLKDSNQTKKQLLTQFEQKIHNKQIANHQEIQRYQSKISQLNLRVAQLQSQLASK